MSQNRVVIYSNGIADFQRCYSVSAGSTERISIPVRQDHLADVLASFNVYGDVSLDSPPTFRPTNELEGNISIQAGRVIEDLATSLSGARVRVERGSGAIEGTLMGLHEEQEATSGEPVQVKSVIVLTNDGLKRCHLREVQNLAFLDEDVQSEIDKALQRNFQRIKPNSTFVELSVSTTCDETDAIVQYTIPAAAWKISYRLRMTDDCPAEFQGFAIVDNNTEEDWNDFTVCVVTGEPITFSTDLADSKTPRRKHIDLVSDSALGAVDVEAPIVLASMAAPAGGAAEEDAAEYADIKLGGAMSLGQSASSMRMAKITQSAKVESAEVQEVGDFCIFESQSPVTIPAKRSTVIPVFNVEVAEVKSVLHYKHENHAERPYRSIEFKNETDFSLGRGVCTVFEDGAYGGNCVVPAMKHGESRLLAHALETGVAIRRDDKRQRNKIVSISLADGFCYTSTIQRRDTEYCLRNNRDHEFELLLDHDHMLSEPETEASLFHEEAEEPLTVSAELSGGARYSITVPPKAEMRLRVSEKRLDKSEVQLIDVGSQHENVKIRWLENNLVKTNGPLANDPGVQNCLSIFRERQSLHDKIIDLVKQTEQLAARQDRLRKNIKSGGQDDLTSRWRKELDEAEQQIREIDEETVPELREQEKEIQDRLREALKSLSAEWADDSQAQSP